MYDPASMEVAHPCGHLLGYIVALLSREGLRPHVEVLV